MFELIPMNRRMPMSYRPLRGFEEFFENPYRGMMMNAFSTDIIDKGDSFELNAELPGFKKEDIDISIDGDTLTISAERKEEESKEEPNFVSKERFYGSFSRKFDLTGIDVDQIEAAYKDGVLSLTLPKEKKEEPKNKKIEINK